MASTVLTRTPSSNGSQRIMTFSAWLKKSFSSGGGTFFSTGSNGNNVFALYFTGQEKLQIEYYNGSTNYFLRTNRVFRDTSAWYHVVLVLDTTDATESNRMRIYVNGVEETSFDAAFYPTQNFDVQYLNSTSYQNNVGNYNGASFFNGILSHVHFIDGTIYTPSAFGEYDANGVWKIKTDVSVTYGTNGFFILKDGNSVTDQSGNGNNFTVASGTLTNTEDNPSNVFATWNPLIVANYQPSFSNGNTRIQFSTSGSTNQASSTLAANSGKYYSEFKIDASGTIVIGITASQDAGGNSFPGRTSQSWGMLHTGAVYVNDNTSTYPSYGDSFTTGDIIGIAMDLDNNYLYFSKNGTWQNSADPTSGATGTGAIDISSSSASDMMFSSAVETGSCAVSANFGNGYFGTTAVASAGTNASGIGIFEYDVPTGYTALSTKGLNE